jgi:hypothetical protein
MALFDFFYPLFVEEVGRQVDLVGLGVALVVGRDVRVVFIVESHMVLVVLWEMHRGFRDTEMLRKVTLFVVIGSHVRVVSVWMCLMDRRAHVDRFSGNLWRSDMDAKLSWVVAIRRRVLGIDLLRTSMVLFHLLIDGHVSFQVGLKGLIHLWMLRHLMLIIRHHWRVLDRERSNLVLHDRLWGTWLLVLVHLFMMDRVGVTSHSMVLLLGISIHGLSLLFLSLRVDRQRRVSLGW